MENQHRRISGYRELNQDEIDLMNKVKQLGVTFEAVLLEVLAHIEGQQDEAYGHIYDPEMGRKVAYGSQLPEADAAALIKRLTDATPERFAALAKTDMQTSLMYLTRAVAQPTFF